MITGNVRPIFPTYLSEYLDLLPAYDTWEGSYEMLDLLREIWESDNYYNMLVPFPNDIVGTGSGTGSGNILNFIAAETKTGGITVPPYSYLISMGGYAKASGREVGTPGFKYRLYDKGAKTDLFYGTYALSQVAASYGDQDPELPTQPYPYGPYLAQSPLVVLPPGALQIEITNLDSTNAATIQMLFGFAVPKSRVSLNVVKQGPAQ